jgi:protein gp37
MARINTQGHDFLKNKLQENQAKAIIRKLEALYPETGYPRLPLSNVWLGTSIETQEAFEARAYHLQELKKQGWKTFYSCEPLLEPLSLNLDVMPVDLVITGYESGHNAREPIGGEDAVRSLRDQCVAIGTKFFYKQKVENGKKISLPELDGKAWSELP